MQKVLFLFRQEKNEKKPTQGALCAALPRAKSAPLSNPRPHLGSAEKLNLETRRSKNVPIFAPLRRCFRDGRAQVGTLAPRGSTIVSLNYRRGFPKGGGFVKSHPLVEFFGYFLIQR